MTPLEAIPKITELMTVLIERVKDRNTSSLVSQIQSLNQTVQSGYFSAKEEALKLTSENFDLKRKIAEMEDAHPKAITAIQESHNAEISRLTKRKVTPKFKFINDQPEANYGVKG